MSTFNGTVINGALNLRASYNTSATRLTQIPNGTNIQVNLVSGQNQWFKTTYGGYTGYVLAQYVAVTNDGGTCTVTTASGSLNIRQAPSTNASRLYTAAQNSTLRLLDCTSVSGWYMVSSASGTGWGSDTYLTIVTYPDGSGSGSGSGSTTTVTYSFSSADAVTYALNHSETTGSSPCSNRNISFSYSESNNCANFVSQCLCAGGAPMFDGWFYRFTGIPSSWTDSKWNVTYSGYSKLNAKGWIDEVAYNAIQPGDFIYTYNASASPTPYTHVTIAVSANLTSGTKYGCNVCGYSVYQHNVFKELTASNCKCYRMKTSLHGNGSEVRVSLPLSGSGATVL